MTAFVSPPRTTFAKRAPLPDRLWARARGVLGRHDRGPRLLPLAVLLDVDGTLVREVPYNADPAAVEPMPGVREALDLLRAAGIRLGVVANQSGIGRGLLTETEAATVNDRIEELLGPFEVWALCPHSPADGCACRKPRPGLVHEAARRLGIEPRSCVVVGDVLGDAVAARGAGARSLLVAPLRPLGPEFAHHEWAPDLAAAARLILGT